MFNNDACLYFIWLNSLCSPPACFNLFQWHDMLIFTGATCSSTSQQRFLRFALKSLWNQNEINTLQITKHLAEALRGTVVEIVRYAAFPPTDDRLRFLCRKKWAIYLYFPGFFESNCEENPKWNLICVGQNCVNTNCAHMKWFCTTIWSFVKNMTLVIQPRFVFLWSWN